MHNISRSWFFMSLRGKYNSKLPVLTIVPRYVYVPTDHENHDLSTYTSHSLPSILTWASWSQHQDIAFLEAEFVGCTLEDVGSPRDFVLLLLLEAWTQRTAMTGHSNLQQIFRSKTKEWKYYFWPTPFATNKQINMAYLSITQFLF